MKPVKVKGQNADFAKPRDWDDKRDGTCGNLPVRVETQKDSIYNIHVSNWLPNAEELAILNAGGVVELECVGVQMPVALTAVVREPDPDDKG